MRRVILGSQGLVVSSQGLGCMGMTAPDAPADGVEAIATIHRALELGVTFLDTADIYGRQTNEVLIGRAIAGHREEVQLATKFGLRLDPVRGGLIVSGRPEYVRDAVEGSLRRLGVEHIDLCYQHRVDPDVPIEETVGALSELVEAGKIRFVGLSEASPDTVRRAHAVHPITALQTEYSLWSRSVEAAVLPTLAELGIGFVAYSPLGRGFLTGELRSVDQLHVNDQRRDDPRLRGANLAHNLGLVARLNKIARRKNVTPGQLALAWICARDKRIVAIPGTKQRRFLEENTAASSIVLSEADLEELDLAAPPGAAAGERYVDMSLIDD